MADRRRPSLEDAQRQEDGQRHTQQPGRDDHHRRDPAHRLLALRHLASLLLALLEDFLRDHLRRQEDADGNDRHLVEQPNDWYEVGYGVYGTKNVADDEGGEGLGVPR